MIEYKEFQLVSDYKPSGDQPKAIEQLTEGLRSGHKYQTLLGITGSGKTFTMANVIANVQRPTLVISHNKTLAAQLYGEFKEFFPHNAVSYFVSFYDYYQPEAYMPQTDTYIEKDVRTNEDLNRLRLAATSALMSRRDVIIVASVSCIYNIGSPEEYEGQAVRLKLGDTMKRGKLLRALVDIRYERNNTDLIRGAFRTRGDVIEIFPSYMDNAYRIELFGDEVDKITEINTLTGEVITRPEEIFIYPAKHFMTSEDKMEQAFIDIEKELQERVDYFTSRNKLIEAQRIEMRTRFDLEMMREIGFCNGIENYSRHLSGLNPGDPPFSLMGYFPKDYLVFIDESHVSLPQIRGMYFGDRSRKQTLVEYGFRLPSALDNRPMQFDEFHSHINQLIFVSATPDEYEIGISQQVAEQIVRPTGLMDPQITVKPLQGQVDDLIGEIKKRAENNQRVLVTTLTKRMAEDLSEYFTEMGIKARYMHSEIHTIERTEIIRDLREAKFDVLVGINLLREGLDLPEVSLVAILNADSQGFLRSATAMIQIAGRAARNIDGAVIMYADTITPAMDKVIKETERRRKAQLEYNKLHGITPASIDKAIRDMIESSAYKEEELETAKIDTFMPSEDIERIIAELESEMREAASKLEFEKAAAIRDQINEMKSAL
ncbi:MAG: excinuclease subunit [Candidatus Poribacteria bacterium]|nr:excinuclease subunit [Candidatus Poribacteria bacterium]